MKFIFPYKIKNTQKGYMATAIAYYSTIIICFCLCLSCNESEDFSLTGPVPPEPDFSVEALPDDPNRFVVTDLSSGNFSHLWDFGNEATPKTSTLKQDTVFYAKQGTYTIALHVTAADGNGTNYREQTVMVAEDAPLACSEDLVNLTDNCTTKCWRLSNAAGSVSVGPEPLSSAWFASSGLEPTQLDDQWCLDIENSVFDYQNNGSSFSACQGYIEVAGYPVPADATFDYLPGGGYEGTDRIVLLADGSWMGVEDSGPTYDIISVTAQQLVLLAPIKHCDSGDPGFFTLTFVAE